MARAKLSGSLLAGRDAPPAATPARDLAAMTQDADEQALGSPVLVWSARLKDEAEPNNAKDTGDAVHRAAEAPRATDLDPPAIGAAAGAAHDGAVDRRSGSRDGHSPTLRWTAFRAAAIGISILAAGSVSGILFLASSEGKGSTETALSAAPPTTAGKLTSGAAEREMQPPAKAANVVPPQGFPDTAATNAAPASATPNEPLPNQPSTGASGTAPIVAVADPALPGEASPRGPKVSGSIPSTNLPVGAAEPSTAVTDPAASAALNSTLMERGDSLFIIGDLSAARLFYERAADAGYGPAALRMGETYDPAFLARTGFIGARANPTMAAYWYQRAHDLGASEAGILLKAIAAETDH
jgi:hypothetical protein